MNRGRLDGTCRKDPMQPSLQVFELALGEAEITPRMFEKGKLRTRLQLLQDGRVLA